MNVNRAILIGNAGNDCELRQTKKGVDVTNFFLATSEKDRTQWHRVVCWDRAARYAAAKVKKGSLVYVEGSIVYNQRDDGNGGKKYITEVRAAKIKKLKDRRPPNGQSAEGPGA